SAPNRYTGRDLFHRDEPRGDQTGADKTGCEYDLFWHSLTQRAAALLLELSAKQNNWAMRSYLQRREGDALCGNKASSHSERMGLVEQCNNGANTRLAKSMLSRLMFVCCEWMVRRTGPLTRLSAICEQSLRIPVDVYRDSGAM